MSSPTVPPEEFLRRERLMGVRKGVSAGGWTPLTPDAKCPELLDATWMAQRLVQEIRLVDVDQLGPGEHPDDAADGQEDPERDRLLASLGPLARDDRHAHDGPRQEGDQESGYDRRAEVNPHHAAQLHVAHAHSARVREGRQEQEEKRTGTRYEVLDGVAPVCDQDGDYAPDREWVHDLVWQQLVVEVDARQRNQPRDEGQLDDEVVV